MNVLHTINVNAALEPEIRATYREMAAEWPRPAIFETEKMLRFARQHDWGWNARLTLDDGVEVDDEYEHVYPDGSATIRWRRTTFYSLREMRDWAGY